MPPSPADTHHHRRLEGAADRLGAHAIRRRHHILENTNSVQARTWIDVWFPAQVAVASCTLHQRGQNVNHNLPDWHWEAFDGDYDDMSICKDLNPEVDFAHASNPDRSKKGCSYTCDAGWEGINCDIDSSTVALAQDEWFPLANGFNNLGQCTTCPSHFAPVTANAVRIVRDSGTRVFSVTEVACTDTAGNTITASGARTDYWHWQRRKSGWAPALLNGATTWGGADQVNAKTDITVWFPSTVAIGSCTLHQRGQNVNHNLADWHWEAFNGNFEDPTCKDTHPAVDWTHATVPGLAKAGCQYTCSAGWEGINCDVDSSTITHAADAWYSIPNGFNNEGKCTTCTSHFAPVTTNAIRVVNDKTTSGTRVFTVTEVDCMDVDGNAIVITSARTNDWPDWQRRSDGVASTKLTNGLTAYTNDNFVQARDWINVRFAAEAQVASCTLHQRGQNANHNLPDWHWEAFNGDFVDTADGVSFA